LNPSLITFFVLDSTLEEITNVLWREVLGSGHEEMEEMEAFKSYGKLWSRG
jgi:hypothetical protein